jgi:hypothetical protein
MKPLLSLSQISTYRDKLSLIQNDDGSLAVYGGVVNVTFPVSAAEILLWQLDGKAIVELRVAIYCQKTSNRLMTLNIDLTVEQAQELRRLVPKLSFSDKREVAA